MKQLICEMCGSTDLVKQDGVFVCQTCGIKYSVEEAKKMMVEGTVEVTGSVKVDSSEKVQNLYVMARRAKDENNAELAAKYYEMIMMESPHDWEALFYSNYFKAKDTNLRNLSYSVQRLNNSLNSIFEAIDKSGKSSNEKWTIAEEVIVNIDSMCESFVSWAKSHYREFSNSDNSVSELNDRANAVADLQKKMADLLEQYFADQSEKARIAYLKSYVENYLFLGTLDTNFARIILKFHSSELVEAENRIKAIEPDYQSLVDEIKKEKNDTEESDKEMQNNETIDNTQNDGEMIQVNYQVGHYSVNNQWYSSPNSVGGNTVRYAIKNIGTKPIKYYSFCFVPYNSVGDVEKCTISRRAEKWVRGTGPIPPNGISGERYFENAWYNSSIESVKLIKAEIEYMDGTAKVIQGDQITSIANSNRINSNSKVFETMGGIIGLILGIVGFETIGFIGLIFAVLIGVGIGFLVDKGNGKNKQTEQREEGNQKNNSDNNKQYKIDQKDDKSEDYHSQESPKTSKQDKKSKKKIGIICLSAIAVIIALVVAISTFGGKTDNKLVGTWRSELNSSLITFEDDGDMILNPSTVGDDKLSYRVNGKTLTMIFANNETVTFNFEVKGDTLILGEDYYSRVE